MITMRRSSFSLIAPLALLLTACGESSSNPNSGGLAGSGGVANGGSGGTAVGAAGSAGATHQNGGTAGGSTGGTQTTAGTGGVAGAATAGAGGSTGGTASGGASGAVGGGGAGGAAGAGGTGPHIQYTCPPGPYEEQMMGQSTDVCVDFQFSGNWNEGPTWIASQNAFFFTTFPIGSATGGDIIKYTIGGDCEVWLADAACNGLAVSATGQLLAACQGPRAVMEYDVVSKEGRMVATMVDGEMLDSPNDLIARSDGNIYFSNRTAELGNRPVGLGEGLVRIDPLGNTSVIQMGGLNGVGLSPDESMLHVVNMGTWALDAAGVPGQNGGPTPNGDGFAVDCAGNILSNGTNSAFGGPDGKTLLIVGGTTARIVEMTVPGLP